MTDTTEGRTEPRVGFTRPDLIEAMKQTVNALYFDDSSDFKSSLWAVLRALNKPLADLLQADPKAAFMCINDMDRRKEGLMEKDPWVCIEGMTPSELDAYDYGVMGAVNAIDNILSGKDTGEGVSNEPWESRRRKLIALVNAPKATGRQ